jgi:hypothetical protein
LEEQGDLPMSPERGGEKRRGEVAQKDILKKVFV